MTAKSIFRIAILAAVLLTGVLSLKGDEGAHCSETRSGQIGCNCSYGWGGDSCDEPLVCVITQPADVTFKKSKNQLVEPIHVRTAIKNYQFKWKGPTCDPRCLDQLFNSTVVNMTLTSDITTIYFVPFDSLCNAVEPKAIITWTWTWIGSGVALVTLLSIVGVLIFIRFRRRSSIVGYTQRLVNESVEIERC